MILAAIDYLSISINLLLVIFVIVCLLMSLLILMQRPKQEGLGAAFGAGVTDQVFGARTTNVLQRGTVYLGSMFFIMSLALAILIGLKNKQVKLVDPNAPVAAKVDEKKVEMPVVPKSLADELPAPVPVVPTPTPADVPADAAAPGMPLETIPATPAAEVPPVIPAPAETPAPEVSPLTPAPETAPQAVPTDPPAETPEKP